MAAEAANIPTDYCPSRADGGEFIGDKKMCEKCWSIREAIEAIGS
jgi:hypothetical protein